MEYEVYEAHKNFWSSPSLSPLMSMRDFTAWSRRTLQFRLHVVNAAIPSIELLPGTTWYRTTAQ